MDKLEQAARAAQLKIQFNDFGHADENGDWIITAGQVERLEAVCKDAARAVLEAIREPDEAMLVAGTQAIFDAEEDWQSNACHRAMIDTILRGEK